MTRRRKGDKEKQPVLEVGWNKYSARKLRASARCYIFVLALIVGVIGEGAAAEEGSVAGGGG